MTCSPSTTQIVVFRVWLRAYKQRLRRALRPFLKVLTQFWAFVQLQQKIASCSLLAPNAGSAVPAVLPPAQQMLGMCPAPRPWMFLNQLAQ